MRVSELKTSAESGHARVSAVVQWEDCERPAREVYIGTHERFGGDLTCNSNVFLTGVLIPAMRHGEQRVLVDGKVCPQLRNGLITAMELLRSWYGEAGHRPVQIEATRGFDPPTRCKVPRTGSFMSGGVDALATLRSNRLNFDLDHPGSIRDCFFVHGFQLGAYESRDDKMSNFLLAVSSLSELAKSTEATLIPVYTNLRHLDDYLNFFSLEFHGAFLAAIAHAFSRRISAGLIASSCSIKDQVPFGTHPLLDSNFSTAGVSIHHDGVRYSRQEKMRLVAQWDEGLRTLRCCTQSLPPTGVLNCGQCEKCIRTMIELLLLDKLNQCPTFQYNDVTADMIGTLRVTVGEGPFDPRKQFPFVPHVFLNWGNAHHWREMVEALKEIGRRDLAKAIERKLVEFNRYRTIVTVRGRLSRFDRRFLRGTLSKTYRLVRGRGRSKCRD